MRILNLMPATCFKQVGTEVTADWKSCGMLDKHIIWNIEQVNRLIGNRRLYHEMV